MPGCVRLLGGLLLSVAMAAATHAQVFEIGEDGTVRDAPGIPGRQPDPADGQPEAEAGSAAAAAPAPPVGRWAVQLGAYETLELLEADWRRIRDRHGDLLKGHAVVRAEAMIGGRRYLRLSALGFPDLNAARRLCAALNGRGQSCYIRDGAPEGTSAR